MEVGSQKQRWVKYGSNVLLSCVVVIALAGVATYLAQANPLRLDTTLGGTQSLRPQTIQFIHDLKADVKIVGAVSQAAERRPTAGGLPAGGRSAE